ncbi:MAG: hypothetical protein RBT78_03100, partial [Kiritimatiellia bacterium]|nr:hypothetical protein [Kiritimatiellia bacterium]
MKRNGFAWLAGIVFGFGVAGCAQVASRPPPRACEPPDRSVGLYVATNGTDTAAGTLENPFATLERARDEIRRIRNGKGLPEGGVTVWVRGGVYALGRTLHLTAEDAGTRTSPVVYRAYGQERPVLTGGRRITGFVPYRDGILKTDLAAQNLEGV